MGFVPKSATSSRADNMFQIVTFYKFTGLSDLTSIGTALKAAMRQHDITGTIILADEGFNSTLSGLPENIGAFLEIAEMIFGCSIRFKLSFHRQRPFRRIEVKMKPEIVTLRKQVEIANGEGTHVDAEEWNAIISDPETVVLDARNHYEVLNGSFERAVDPKTSKFSDLPEFVEKNLDPAKHKQIAMYCTGGIRCEKFAPYLKAKGFENVFQLEGGILNYLERVPKERSLWRGECFVFDDRITVDSELKKGTQPDHSLAPVG